MNRAVYIAILIMLAVWPHATHAAACNGTDTDSLVQKIMERNLSDKRLTGERFGRLYIKQRTGAFKNNLLLNAFPGMPRFSKGKKNYITELFYQFHHTGYGIMELRRRSHNTSFRHGDGETERATDFAKTDPRDSRYLQNIFSPLYPAHTKYYSYAADSTAAHNGKIYRRISFKSRFDNIRLLEEGWMWIDDSCHISELYFRGWDEQSRFEATYTMDETTNTVSSVHADIDYSFIGNRLNIVTDAIFDYDYILPADIAKSSNTDKYNLTANENIVWDTTAIADRKEYARKNRRIELDSDEIPALSEPDTDAAAQQQPAEKKRRNERIWNLGDKMISSHSYNWNRGDIRLSPIIDPSHVDYSSSRGLSYKLSMNMKSQLSRDRELRFKPQIGYNFKQKAVYWNADGRLLYAPARQGEFAVSAGEGNHTYSSAVLDRIKEMNPDSLNFDKLNLRYFRNLYLETSHKSEIANGLTLLTGASFHRRELEQNPDRIPGSHGTTLKDTYSQFAPHMRITWQPGMYYYMNGRQKVNIGSSHPAISLDVEQGVNGILGSNSIYTRAELDIQYKLPMRTDGNLYMRFGTGGYLYTKDVYFVDYAFLKSNSLPLERSEELGGVFQLLDAEWYNAANRYVRGNLTYETTYHSLQKLFPRIKFLKNEYIYCNMLLLSQLRPYMELGYGIATPYVDMGLFVSSQNGRMHRIGYKISFSLFSN